MPKDIGPKEKALRAMREARAAARQTPAPTKTVKKAARKKS